MAVDLELQAGETVLKEIRGDYWEKLFLFLYSQKIGQYWFTSERIVFRGEFVADLNLSYKEIQEVKACAVGPAIPFIPTGIKVTMKDGKSYKLSVLRRKKIMELISSRM